MLIGASPCNEPLTGNVDRNGVDTWCKCGREVRILSDRDGTSCEPEFTDAAKSYLEDLGYSVQVNFPMKGVELVRRYSDPAANRHSLQIEMNRRHYMNEDIIERTANFEPFKAVVTGLVSELATYVKTKA